ncbi:MAG: ATP-dependent zinc metalloprotease FtsH [Alphaproteobacteria bacterium]|nr:ATP-dependent zinc metalloprotease FtsH [Alphaproteobacteria bacterium]
MSVNQKHFWILICAVLGLALVYNSMDNSRQTAQSHVVEYSAFKKAVDTQKVREASLKGDLVIGKYVTGDVFVTRIPSHLQVANLLTAQGVRVEALDREDDIPSFWSILISWFPVLLFIAVWVYFYRQMNSKGGNVMGFGRAKTKSLTEHQRIVRFKDVAGVEEAKEELQEIVDYLKDPDRYQRLGGKLPRGVLLVGPPGTGKTLLARAVAGEAGVSFFSISGSDFVEMFVGVGASRVRDLFEQAKKKSPCIVFVDEIDAVGRHRGAGMGGGNDEREQTLNQLLVEMDGFEPQVNIIIIAATNRPDVLDKALLRPGRFDRQVVVPLPDVRGREAIVRVHLEKVRHTADVEPLVIARGTPGFSGADLANIVNESALLAARSGKQKVDATDLEEAKDKVMMGAERRSMVMSENEKKLTAYHEAGHALVAVHTPGSDPIHKVTVIPRGRALGMVMQLPDKDVLSVTRAKLRGDIAIAMGGRVAEEMIFGADNMTTGAESDIQMATERAKAMVGRWGMSDDLGPLNYMQDTNPFTSNGEALPISDKVAERMDKEVCRIVLEGYESARKVLKKHKDQLELLAQVLLQRETLTGADVTALLSGKDLGPIPQKRKVVRRKTSLTPGPEMKTTKTIKKAPKK